MDDLLKDAIADAKAVRETALANAKLALEEAFTPRIQNMLSQKIQSEIEDEDEVADADEMAHEEGEDHDEEEAPEAPEAEAPEVAVEPEEGEEVADIADEIEDEDDMEEDRVALDGVEDKEDGVDEKVYSDEETVPQPVVDDLSASGHGADRNIGNDGGVFDDDEIDFDWDDFDDIMEDDTSKGDT